MIILLIGLPGSGKTTYAKEFIDFRLIDDPKTQPIISPYENVIIADPNLCDPNILKSALSYLDGDVELVHWENNPEQCIQNVLRRIVPNPSLVIPAINRLTRVYSPPKESRKVWYPKKNS